MTGQQHVLYRFHNRAGELLYIGITVDPGARWRKHRDEKPWIDAQEKIQGCRLSVDLDHPTPKGSLHRLKHAPAGHGDPKRKTQQRDNRSHQPLT